jgi:hypothetical protein
VRYTLEMALDAMIYIPILIKIGSDIQNLIEGDTHTDTQTDMK